MARRKKVTWNDIFKDFKQRHPKYANSVLHFQPYDYATILLSFPGRVRMTYNYDSKTLLDYDR